MRILNYEYQDLGSRGWHFNRAEFTRLNLIVGDTASGKTRFLNTIFNLGSSVVGTRPIGAPNRVTINFAHNDDLYNWEIRTDLGEDNKPVVLQESLDRSRGKTTKTIVRRTPTEFYFHNTALPRLRGDQYSVSLLKDEEDMKPIYQAFGQILRRNFFSDALQDVLPASRLTNPLLADRPVTSLLQLHNMGLPMNLKLFILRNSFPEIYQSICDCFVSVFPFLSEVDIKELRDLMPKITPPGPTPVFAVREKGLKGWIGIDQLSSGMQKVMLIITDSLSLPKGSIYLIDEYENSLGISAIDFFPEFISTHANDVQFIITSHHPYLINNIPPQNWLVFSRKGAKVRIRYGKENIDIYGTSKQKRFIQLINDPFYSENH